MISRIPLLDCFPSGDFADESGRRFTITRYRYGAACTFAGRGRDECFSALLGGESLYVLFGDLPSVTKLDGVIEPPDPAFEQACTLTFTEAHAHAFQIRLDWDRRENLGMEISLGDRVVASLMLRARGQG